ncbi:MAG: NifB/NifX family molybdenum-iron cluster-binding protein [Promethearchaeota archaeon]
MVKKCAISTDGNNVSAHFGRCPSYTIFDVSEVGKITNRKEIPNPGHSTGFIPKYLNDLAIDVIIAGGMGRRAIDLFQEFNIEPIVGIIGSIDETINKIINGSLEGGESLCSPGLGENYGIPKLDGHGLGGHGQGGHGQGGHGHDGHGHDGHGHDGF